MSTKIDDLLPDMQIKVGEFLSLIHIPYIVTSTLRGVDEQLAYYAKGRAPLEIVNILHMKAGLHVVTESDNIKVTNCDGVIVKSNHQSGRAMDVVPCDANGRPIWPHPADPRWEILGKLGEAAGLLWGGRWSNPDLPHYELKVV